MRDLNEIIHANNEAVIQAAFNDGILPGDWTNHKPFFTLEDEEEMEPHNDAPERCGVCHFGVKYVLGRLGNMEHLQCRDCGARFARPVRDGIVITSEEEILED